MSNLDGRILGRNNVNKGLWRAFTHLLIFIYSISKWNDISTQKYKANTMTGSWRYFSGTLLRTTGISCLICLSFLICGAARTYTSYLIAQINDDRTLYTINTGEASWLGCLCSMMNPIGFLISGYLMDVFGRRWSTKGIYLPFLFGWLSISFANSKVLLYAGTSLHGIASGMAMSATVYISEISAPCHRGILLSVLGLSYMLGNVLCSVMCYLFLWRYTAIYFAAMSLIMLPVTYFIPESPYWLILNGRTSEAVGVLEWLRSKREVSEEVTDIKVGIEETKDIDGKTNQFSSLCAAWRQMSILVVIATTHKISGFTPINQYAVYFFNSLRTPLDGYLVSIIHSVVCFLSTIIVPFFMHNCNRRTLLLVTSIIAGSGIMITYVYEYFFYMMSMKPYYWTPVMGILVYDVACTLGSTSIAMMLPGELLPTDISGIGSAFYSIVCSITVTAISKMYLITFDLIGLNSMLLIFASFCFLNVLLSVVVLPETRGKSLREIQDIYFKPKK